ncbi:MAG: tRNA (cytosine(32)/uridine(32)-2'-O)-methyltransferase TrmJ [Alphaproteobacteria bacterium]|nr:tRNA (cytosine(32)/uridine(32)-2'-O)-methyltransferase TrmJ [Alphaproteobacteria bacterium]MCB9697903.1 tRNA (cytosine(32)/uridine(32)-2'-O)-methyltransferase TrmJ [Alphaproteobacteria bacterium]
MSDLPDIAGRVTVVLVQPLHPGNVGAAARAMKNFGLRDLVLVDPPAWDPERARWMAPGCDDVFAAMRIVGTLDEALAGCHRAIGTTARHRRVGPPVIEPTPAAEAMLDGDHRTALLFGREDSGLPNEAVLHCDALIRIATPEHASLNLGQAVLLLTHTLWEEARRRGARATGRTLGGTRERSTREAGQPDRKDRRAEIDVLEPAVQQIVDLLGRVGYLRGTPADKVRVTARQALRAASISVRQVEALRGMVARVDWALDNPGVDWAKTSKRH